MDRESVVCLYKGILFSHKKEWSTDTHYNVIKPQKHYVQWKKSDIKGHTMHASVFIKCLEDQNSFLCFVLTLVHFIIKNEDTKLPPLWEN